MKLLIVEDELALRTSLVDYLRQDGYVVEAAASYEQAHEKIKLYDCVLLDLTLPDGNGLDVVRTLKADRSPAGEPSNRHSATTTDYREQSSNCPVCGPLPTSTIIPQKTDEEKNVAYLANGLIRPVGLRGLRPTSGSG